MEKVFVLQGSNEGDRKEILDLSLIELTKRVGGVLSVSSVYESEPWGFEAKQWFLNRIVVLESALDPLNILEILLTIESEFGRKRIADGRYHTRTLDLDILLINQQILSLPTLTIPHPQLQNRRFTLWPLAELVPDFNHPVLNKSISELLIECPDKSEVHLYKD
jgi:2-amino-4-hydroxy-6-hydroxymethyldihydropteridine diphosphokinase